MSAPSARERNQAERRHRVLESAMYLAAKGGYESVQMRDVAAEAEVSMGTIYRYFGSKDEMLLAGFARWVRHTRRQLGEHGPVGDNPGERVANALASAVAKSEKAPLLMEALLTAMANPDPAYVVYKREIGDGMHGIIGDAVGIEDAVDVDGVARVVSHVWFSSIMRWVSGVAPAGSVSEELRYAVSLLLPQTEALTIASVIDLQESVGVSNSMQADAGTAGLNR